MIISILVAESCNWQLWLRGLTREAMFPPRLLFEAGINGRVSFSRDSPYTKVPGNALELIKRQE
jgi:hypothetical protein